MVKQAITILGSSGTIGCRALEVIARHRHRYRIFALTARSNIRMLAKQCREFAPRYAVVTESRHTADFKRLLGASSTQVLDKPEALADVAADARCDTVLAGLVGIAGLLPVLAAAEAGKRILLANKEVLVSAGPLFMHTVQQNNALLLPVDSEHNGLFQCLHPAAPNRFNLDGIEKIILTASGGPLLQTPLTDLPKVTPAQTRAHPNWEMGAKICVDSATLMNKGLEVIEACRLFGLTADQVAAIVHPQSLVHAMVWMKDGSVLAQMSQPDMRVPLAHALAWPHRIDSGIAPLDLTQYQDLSFHAIDSKRFPCFNLAYQAWRQGEAALISLNAANEVAVAAFLAGTIRFNVIADVIQKVLESTAAQTTSLTTAPDIRMIMQIDLRAREHAQLAMHQLSNI